MTNIDYPGIPCTLEKAIREYQSLTGDKVVLGGFVKDQPYNFRDLTLHFYSEGDPYPFLSIGTKQPVRVIRQMMIYFKQGLF